MRGGAAAYAYLVLASLAPSFSTSPGETSPEPEHSAATRSIDGQDYPLWQRIRGAKQTLVGGGTRYKFGVVKVYAAGLYVDEAAIEGPLRSFRSSSAKALQADTAFLETVIELPAPKTLLLQFHRSVDAGAVTGALKDALSPRLDAPVLAAFDEALAAALQPTGVPAGLKLYLSCSEGGLHIGVQSTEAARSVVEPAVCPALFDVYFGSAPISTPIRDGMAAGFAELK